MLTGDKVCSDFLHTLQFGMKIFLRNRSIPILVSLSPNFSLTVIKQKLVKYEIKKTDERQLFLHGVFMHANLKKEELRRGERKVACNAMTGVFNLEGETVHICNNSLQSLLCIGPKTWKRLQNDAMLPEARHTENYEDDINKTSSCTQRVIDYLFDIFKEEDDTNGHNKNISYQNHNNDIETSNIKK